MDGGEPAVRTKRLLLRPWQDADREPFAIMNSDPRVTEHFVERYSRERSDSFLDRIRSRWDELGYGLWATERLDIGAFIGYVGLWPAGFNAPFTPAVEVGWRLVAAQWGHGFASEGARAALRYGFTTVGLAGIVSFTSVTNRRSWRVMERLGMVRDAASDFDHPAVPVGHSLRPHVLYRMSSQRFADPYGASAVRGSDQEHLGSRAPIEG